MSETTRIEVGKGQRVTYVEYSKGGGMIHVTARGKHSPRWVLYRAIEKEDRERGETPFYRLLLAVIADDTFDHSPKCYAQRVTWRGDA